MPAGMKIIQMVLKAGHFAFTKSGSNRQATRRRRSSFDVKRFVSDTHRMEQATGASRLDDGVGFAGFELGPVNSAAIKVAGIEQWHGAVFGFFTQRVLEPEVHDASGGDGHT